MPRVLRDFYNKIDEDIRNMTFSEVKLWAGIIRGLNTHPLQPLFIVSTVLLKNFLEVTASYGLDKTNPALSEGSRETALIQLENAAQQIEILKKKLQES